MSLDSIERPTQTNVDFPGDTQDIALPEQFSSKKVFSLLGRIENDLLRTLQEIYGDKSQEGAFIKNSERVAVVMGLIQKKVTDLTTHADIESFVQEVRHIIRLESLPNATFIDQQIDAPVVKLLYKTVKFYYEKYSSITREHNGAENPQVQLGTGQPTAWLKPYNEELENGELNPRKVLIYLKRIKLLCESDEEVSDMIERLGISHDLYMLWEREQDDIRDAIFIIDTAHINIKKPEINANALKYLERILRMESANRESYLESAIQLGLYSKYNQISKSTPQNFQHKKRTYNKTDDMVKRKSSLPPVIQEQIESLYESLANFPLHSSENESTLLKIAATNYEYYGNIAELRARTNKAAVLSKIRMLLQKIPSLSPVESRVLEILDTRITVAGRKKGEFIEAEQKKLILAKLRLLRKQSLDSKTANDFILNEVNVPLTAMMQYTWKRYGYVNKDLDQELLSTEGLAPDIYAQARKEQEEL